MCIVCDGAWLFFSRMPLEPLPKRARRAPGEWVADPLSWEAKQPDA